ncbi:unnamed protein product [Urochloa humidicola]
MDPDAEVDFDFSPFLIRYKSGRVRRLMGTSRVAAGADAATGVTSRDVSINAAGLAARLYIPTDVLNNKPGEKLPVLVYFHGGAFAVHSAFSAPHFRFLNALVSAARVVAVSVDYRLAPEHPVPAAYDDAWAALRWAAVASTRAAGSDSDLDDPWLSAHGDAARLFVAGDSAGANIAHNVALRSAGGGGDLPGCARIEGMVLREGPGVVVGGGDGVLGREAEIDGDGDGARRGDERVEEAEVRAGERRVDGEGAAVEVDEKGKLLAGLVV